MASVRLQDRLIVADLRVVALAFERGGENSWRKLIGLGTKKGAHSQVSWERTTQNLEFALR